MIRATCLAAVLCLGCGDDSQAVSEGRGVVSFEGLPEVVVPERDAGPDPEPDAGEPDAGPADAGFDAGFDAGPGGVDAGPLYVVGDVRTNVPHLGFIDNGTAQLQIASIFFRQVSTTSFESIVIHGEFENRGSVQRCIPLLDVFLDGVSILAVAEGTQHMDDLGGAVACTDPSERSVFRGIVNDIPATLLTDATTLSYTFTALTREYPVHPATPILLSAERVEGDGRHTVRGRLLSTAMPIYNMSLDFYARDERGLVVDDASAFPLDLDTLPTRTVIDYEAFPFGYLDRSPAGLLFEMDFLDGIAPSQTSSVAPSGAAPSPEAERHQEARRRRAALQEQKGRLP